MSIHSLDRRSFLALATGSAATWPLTARAHQQRTTPQDVKRETDSVMSEACSYIAGVDGRELPLDVLAIAKHHVLDTFTAMLTGAQFKVGRLAADFTKSQGGVPEAQVVGTSLITSAINAALANGITAHADETDDSHEPSGNSPRLCDRASGIGRRRKGGPGRLAVPERCGRGIRHRYPHESGS